VTNVTLEAADGTTTALAVHDNVYMTTASVAGASPAITFIEGGHAVSLPPLPVPAN
jgi:hypothetical protein